MRVRCDLNTGEKLTSEHFRAGYTERSVFHVKVGETYAVHGMCLLRSVLCYLVENDLTLPEWVPAMAFEVIESSLPARWRYDFVGSNIGGVEAIWGYEELIEVPGYFDQLSLREADAVEVFRRHIRSA